MAATTQVQALYIAYFGRPADPAGLKFWSNGTLSTEQELDGLADSMATSLEFKASIAGKTNRQVINQIYQNLFNRNADPAGLAFWLEALGEDPSTATAPNFQVLNQLGAPRTNIQDIGSNLVFAVQSKALAGKPDSDTVTLDAKVKGCQEFTDCVEELGVTYVGTLPITKGKAFANAIVLPRDIPSGSETCVIVRNLGTTGYNSGGGDVTANGGGVKGNILTASRMADRIDSEIGAQYEIININTLGKYLLDYNFTFDSFNQVINAVNTADASIQTLQPIDSFTDATTTDNDSVTITAIGGMAIAAATFTRIENINFDLVGFENANINGAIITEAKNLKLKGTLAADTAFAVTNEGFNVIDASDVVATAGTTPEITLSAKTDAATSITGSKTLKNTINGSSEADSLAGGDNNDTLDGKDGADILVGGAGTNTYIFRAGDVDANEVAILSGAKDIFNVVSNTDFSLMNGGLVITGLDEVNLAQGKDAFFKSAQLSGLTIAVNGTADNVVEYLNIGSSADDSTINLANFTLAHVSCTVIGGAASNAIIGSVGSENIIGMDAHDTMTGLDQSDSFRYVGANFAAEVEQTNTKAGGAFADTDTTIDVITDFATTVDNLDFSIDGGGNRFGVMANNDAVATFALAYAAAEVAFTQPGGGAPSTKNYFLTTYGSNTAWTAVLFIDDTANSGTVDGAIQLGATGAYANAAAALDAIVGADII